jgi:hypothetical protein
VYQIGEDQARSWIELGKWLSELASGRSSGASELQSRRE